MVAEKEVVVAEPPCGTCWTTVPESPVTCWCADAGLLDDGPPVVAYIEDSEPSEFLPITPLLGYLAEWVARNPHDSMSALCLRAGTHDTTIAGACARGRIKLKLVDALLVASGASPDVLRDLYPLPEV
jgi:hypothetical protein